MWRRLFDSNYVARALLVFGLVSFPFCASAQVPFLEPNGKIPANALVQIAVPQPNAEDPVIIDVIDPWGNTIWSGATRGASFMLFPWQWTDGTYTVRFSSGEEQNFQVASEYYGQVRARAGFLLRAIDEKRDADGMPPKDLWGASNLLQRLVTEHVYEKRDDEVSGNLYHGELLLGFRTGSATIRILGSGAAHYMDGYEGSYRPYLREAAGMFVPPNTVFDFAEHGERKLERWGLSFRDIEHIFSSHSHADHFHAAAITALAKKRAEAGLPLLTFHSGDAACNQLEQYLSEQKMEEILHIDRLQPGSETEAGPLRVKAVRATHQEDSSPLCYIIHYREATAYYGTDTGYPVAETFEALAAERFDAFVHELTAPSAEDGLGHMDVGDLRLLLGKLRRAGAIDSWTRVVGIHQGMQLHQKLRDPLNFQQTIGYEPAYDGMPIPVAFKTAEIGNRDSGD
jgi:L-ascorbate metabolism protein UlaG (beta-lactamase superfamily)